MPGLGTDPELLAQLPHRKAARSSQDHKSQFFIHRIYFFPRHLCLIGSVTDVSGQSVTYVPGSYQEEPEAGLMGRRSVSISDICRECLHYFAGAGSLTKTRKFLNLDHHPLTVFTMVLPEMACNLLQILGVPAAT